MGQSLTRLLLGDSDYVRTSNLSHHFTHVCYGGNGSEFPAQRLTALQQPSTPESSPSLTVTCYASEQAGTQEERSRR